MFAMKTISIYNDYVNYDEVIIYSSPSFKTYILNIPIHGIFEKDIDLFVKNNTI